MGTLQFTYLGVPIFMGRPKSEFLLPITNKVKCKLSTWKEFAAVSSRSSSTY